MNFKDETLITNVSSLFWKIWNLQKYNFPAKTSITYTFSICSNYHRHLVKYDNESLVLIGARDIKTYEELNIISIAVSKNILCFLLIN